MNNNNKVIVVTGGAQGIGRKIALHFLNDNWKSVIWEIDREAGEELAGGLNHSEFSNIHCDVSCEADVKKAVALTLERFGRIDVLVNNAAIMCNKPLSSLSLAEWQKVIDVNLTGPFLCSKHCEPELKRNRGSIINICLQGHFNLNVTQRPILHQRAGYLP